LPAPKPKGRKLRRILLIAKRDYLATIRTKAFLVGLVVAPILFGGGFLGIALLSSRPDIKERRVAIVDRTGLVASAVIQAAQEKNAEDLFDKATHRQIAPRYVFESLAPGANANAQRLALSDRVRSGQLFAFLEIGPENLHPRHPNHNATAAGVACYTNAGAFANTRHWLSGPINDGLQRVRLAQLGVNASNFDDVLAETSVERLSLVSRDEKTGQIQQGHKKSELDDFAIPFGLVLLLGMIVLVSSAPMLSAVTEDKAQRIVEMLLGLATPFELMMGKVLAAVGVSLSSSAFYVIGGTLVLQGLGMAGMLPFALLPWFYIYLIADVTMLCAFASALGAGCSSPQDAQQLAILLMAPVMIPYFVFAVVMQQPNGAIATALSLFPMFTPMLMLLRMALPGGVPVWQPWVSLAAVLAWTFGMVWAAARIFRVAILMQGKPPKFADLVRWAVRG
jgi:ABC-2 type transport system permease protein